MQARAGIAMRAGAPLEIDTVDLDCARAGAVRPLERINEGFALMQRGRSIRSVVVF
jgi:Zn-dependent alcohol dehydrogenase